MNTTWDKRHAEIFDCYINELNKYNIKYFILRNYEHLPQNNISKDVDIIIKPKELKKARELLLKVYKEHNCTNFHEFINSKAHCLYGINPTEDFGIHIDLIEGYIEKGFEVFEFDELYRHTIEYKNFKVLDELYNGIMIYIFKLFGYIKPILKEEYKKEIYNTYSKFPNEFLNILTRITNKRFANKTIEYIKKNDFKSIIEDAKQLTFLLRKRIIKNRFFYTSKIFFGFILQKIDLYVLGYRKYQKTIAVLAPDGTGKTTFLENLSEKLTILYSKSKEDEKLKIYHFRPNILPNLGELGEKAGIMEQDKNFDNPHRGKPANRISSFCRCAYYTLDYILGWKKIVRLDVKSDRYTVFDRYSYDLIVDPLRTKLNLSKFTRNFFVWFTPKPDIVFVLKASPEIIYSRKQELPKDEIKRQIDEYLSLAKKNKNFIIINAETNPEEMAKMATQIIIDKFTNRL